jgi:hypothetical protein
MEADGEIKPTLGIRRVGSAASGNFSSFRLDFAMKKVDDRESRDHGVVLRLAIGFSSKA